MKITILTLYPEMFRGFLSESILGRAQKSGKVEIDLVNLRDWGIGRHKKVDDTPYGGGAGMVLRPDVVISAIKDLLYKNKMSNSKPSIKAKSLKPKTILMSPQGQKFDQKRAIDLAQDERDLLLVCGHFEGFDERIRDYVDEEISIGDYVLTGGELAAAVITDAIVRLLPGVLGKKESYQDESFSGYIKNKELKINKLLEYPHYTRPENFEGKIVPDVLRSGNHAMINKWRKDESLSRTKKRRPDLL